MTRRTIIVILSMLILLSAAAADAQRARRSKSTTKRTAVTRTKSKSSARTVSVPTISPAEKARNDSIEAQRRRQIRLDSVTALTQKAQQGDVAAITQLGLWYYDGHIVDRDYSKAIELWRKGDDLSDVLATAYLGRCYRLGHGVERDSLEALQLYSKSIRSGNGALFKHCINIAPTDAFAAMLIGNCYGKGDGVKRDLSRAAEYYADAARLGSVDGMRDAGICYYECNDTVQALEYFEKGADRGDNTCRYYTGKLLIDDDASLARAVALIHNASESGEPGAQVMMGNLYATGRGVTRDQHEATRLYKLAADQQYPEGMWQYALALGAGTGVAPDLTQALKLMAEAKATDVIGALNDSTTSAATGLLDTYIQGMKALLDDDFVAASAAAKLLDKAKMPEGNLLNALIAASITNPKASPKKAAKLLSKIAPTVAEASYLLSLVNASGTPTAIDVKKALGHQPPAPKPPSPL